MKKLSPYWFLQEPIDSEHKHYVLMDFIQDLRKELSKRSTKKCTREVFIRLSDLKSFKKNKSISPDRLDPITNRDQRILAKFLEKETPESSKMVHQIIEESEALLYNFSEEMLSILNNLEKLVEVKEFQPIVNQNSETAFSLLLIRSIKTNHVEAYLMKESTIQQDGHSLSGIIMKKVQMSANYQFSADYEFIIHEVLDRIQSKLYTPRVFIAEINADISRNEELVKIAKEKAIGLF
jgi:hypothetical protein